MANETNNRGFSDGKAQQGSQRAYGAGRPAGAAVPSRVPGTVTMDPAAGPRAAGQPGQPGQDAGAPKPKRGHTVAIVVGCVVVALAAWLLIWLFACNGAALLDPNAQDGQAPYKSAEEMQAELDRVVEEGMFNISIAGAIQFDDGAAAGTAYIENVPGNHYLMQVRITDDASGEMLYESGVLKPNQFIEKITLTRDLEPGSYPATATFTALDPATYDEVGQAAAKVTITVLN